jgi:hypothetical protein
MVARRLWVCALATTLVTLAGACTKKDETTTKRLTTAQRDSAIAESKLPGAGVVKKALEVADSAETRANQAIPEPW